MIRSEASGKHPSGIWNVVLFENNPDVQKMYAIFLLLHLFLKLIPLITFQLKAHMNSYLSKLPNIEIIGFKGIDEQHVIFTKIF